MILHIQFQICALLLIFFIIFAFIRQKSLQLISQKVYSYMLLVVAVSLIFDIAAVISIEAFSGAPNLLNEIISKTYLFTLPMVVCILMFYALIDVYGDAKSIPLALKVLFMPMIFLPFILVSFDIYYSWGTDGIYQFGPAVIIAYAYELFYIVSCLIFTFYHRKYMDPKRRNSVWIVLAACFVIGVIKQFYPQCPFAGYILALSTLFMYMRLENPEDNIDKISGCFTTDAFLSYMKEVISQNKKCALISITFDDFRFVNDTFGVEIAKRIIQMVARFLESLKGDIVFCSSNLEFTAIFGNFRDMLEALDKIEQRFKKPWALFGIDVEINLSVGICYLTDCSLISEPQQLADTVHYFSKECLRRGKGTVIPINEEELLKKQEIDDAETILRWALKEEKIDVFYQPIYSMKEKRYVSAEALVRIFDENNICISPELFIPIAERNGLILELGMIVFEKVCAFMQQEQLLNKGIQYVEINLSVVQCMRDSLAQELLQIMDKYKIEPHTINLEITETAAINSEKILLQNMEQLIRENVTFSLDDYGSGYSNLSYVVELPLSIVKVDKSLVWSACVNERASVAMEFAVSMIQKLGMKVLAEGVENIEQYQEMERLNIDFIQGFFFSRPVPPDTFIDVISKPITALKTVPV